MKLVESAHPGLGKLGVFWDAADRLFQHIWQLIASGGFPAASAV